MSTFRAEEPGWFPIGLKLDPVGRRHVWLRVTPGIYGSLVPPACILALEVCCGREGDDGYARIELGQTLDGVALQKLVSALDYGEHQVQLERDYPTNAIEARETLRRWAGCAEQRGEELRREDEPRNADLAFERASAFRLAVQLLDQMPRKNDVWCDEGQCWMAPPDTNRCRVWP